MTATTLNLDRPLELLSDRQRQIVEHPQAASARAMREVAVRLETLASAAENQWFELPEDVRASLRALAVRVRDEVTKTPKNPVAYARSVIKAGAGAWAWLFRPGDVLIFASALQRFVSVVSRKMTEEREGSAAAWLEVSANPAFMAAIKRGDAEIAAGNTVTVDFAEYEQRHTS